MYSCSVDAVLIFFEDVQHNGALLHLGSTIAPPGVFLGLVSHAYFLEQCV
jgi:hypothetical protein